MLTNVAACARLDAFVSGTRAALFVREVDHLLMIRPDKTFTINRSAAAILAALYNRDCRGAAEVLPEVAARLGAEPARLLADATALVEGVGAILREDFSPRSVLKFDAFSPASLPAYPTLAEIALGYGCQNRCVFCYAASPYRADAQRTMTTAEVERVMERIYHDAHVPSLSFTGGEATLRPDLPALIRHGVKIGFRVNLITNGLRAADMEYARTLTAAGLASAQVSLEAGDAALHDEIVGKPGAFARTVAGVRNFAHLGIHVHTNTTLCAQNLASADEVIRFVGRQLGLRTLSMNMVIRTGEALPLPSVGASRPATGVSYTQVAARLPALLEVARAEGVRLVWYSPIPYCIFNPVLFGLGAKSCACVGGILSVDPSGQVLPCSSFANGVGSLLDAEFGSIYAGRAARYWRRKKFVPTVCADCDHVDLCAGACPLYWDAAGSFAELPHCGGAAASPHGYEKWRRGRQKSRTFGVPPSGRV